MWATLSSTGSGIRDALDGKIKICIPGEQIKPGIWVGKGTRIEKNVKLKAPSVIGAIVL